MTKFSDRLKRLHASRVNAGNAAREAEQARDGVYLADDVRETASGPDSPSDRRAERTAWESVGATHHNDAFWLDNHLHSDESHGHYAIGLLGDLSLAQLSRDVLGLFAAPAQSDDTLFIDIESAGLGSGEGNEAWCVGVGHIAGSSFRVRHWILPHPELEAPMLQAVADHISGAKLLVTFNGTAFDLPRLRSHFERHGIADPTSRVDHIDLLKVVRRILPRDHETTLPAAERRLLGFERKHDVPGAESPRRWSAYLRTLNVRPLLPLIEHNKLDIVSLAMILVHCQRTLTGDAVPRVDRSKPLPVPRRTEPTRPTVSASSEPSEFRKKLVRSYRLKNKSSDKRERVRRKPSTELSPTAVARKPASAPAGAAVGERLTELRRSAARLLEAGDDDAIPLLHEMLALSPRNPFPLAELARYYRDVGDDDLANLFESRLRDVAPY